MSTTTNLKILYIDDDSDDCIFLKESLADSGTKADLICFQDGDDAIKYLNSDIKELLPSLIILDLNMPGRDGKQTLNYLKSNPGLSDIPVVILSTSENYMDMEFCKQRGASGYMQKPFHYNGYKEIVKSCIPLMKVH
ncbi:MAG: response regulator [Flavisolibacter sp.]